MEQKELRKYINNIRGLTDFVARELSAIPNTLLKTLNSREANGLLLFETLFGDQHNWSVLIEYNDPAVIAIVEKAIAELTLGRIPTAVKLRELLTVKEFNEIPSFEEITAAIQELHDYSELINLYEFVLNVKIDELPRLDNKAVFCEIINSPEYRERVNIFFDGVPLVDILGESYSSFR